MRLRYRLCLPCYGQQAIAGAAITIGVVSVIITSFIFNPPKIQRITLRYVVHTLLSLSPLTNSDAFRRSFVAE